MNALIVYEAGKTWPEADADTAETIDFLEFYGSRNAPLRRSAKSDAHEG